MSLTPEAQPDLAALAEHAPEEEQQPREAPAAASSAPSVADSLEQIAYGPGQENTGSHAWTSISPVLDFQEFLQRQQRFTVVRWRIKDTAAISVHAPCCLPR
jgi:hypothetical protein